MRVCRSMIWGETSVPTLTVFWNGVTLNIIFIFLVYTERTRGDLWKNYGVVWDCISIIRGSRLSKEDIGISPAEYRNNYSYSTINEVKNYKKEIKQRRQDVAHEKSSNTLRSSINPSHDASKNFLLDTFSNKIPEKSATTWPSFFSNHHRNPLLLTSYDAM